MRFCAEQGEYNAMHKAVFRRTEMFGSQTMELHELMQSLLISSALIIMHRTIMTKALELIINT